MVDVRDHRHVTDVGLLVHDGTDLVDCEVHLRSKEIKLILCHNATTVVAVESSTLAEICRSQLSLSGLKSPTFFLKLIQMVTTDRFCSGDLDSP